MVFLIISINHFFVVLLLCFLGCLIRATFSQCSVVCVSAPGCFGDVFSKLFSQKFCSKSVSPTISCRDLLFAVCVWGAFFKKFRSSSKDPFSQTCDHSTDTMTPYPQRMASILGALFFLGGYLLCFGLNFRTHLIIMVFLIISINHFFVVLLLCFLGCLIRATSSLCWVPAPGCCGDVFYQKRLPRVFVIVFVQECPCKSPWRRVSFKSVPRLFQASVFGHFSFFSQESFPSHMWWFDRYTDPLPQRIQRPFLGRLDCVCLHCLEKFTTIPPPIFFLQCYLWSSSACSPVFDMPFLRLFSGLQTIGYVVS